MRILLATLVSSTLLAGACAQDQSSDPDCASCEETEGSERFVLDEGVLTDTTMNLGWQDTNEPQLLNFSDATTYCESLELQGFSWRLPTIDELDGIFAADFYCLHEEYSYKTEVTVFGSSDAQSWWTGLSNSCGIIQRVRVDTPVTESGRHRVRCVADL